MIRYLVIVAGVLFIVCKANTAEAEPHAPVNRSLTPAVSREQAMIERAYLAFLGREAEAKGMADHLAGLASGAPLEAIINIVAMSEEAKNHAKTATPEKLCEEHGIQAKLYKDLLEYVLERQPPPKTVSLDPEAGGRAAAREIINPEGPVETAKLRLCFHHGKTRSPYWGQSTEARGECEKAARPLQKSESYKKAYSEACYQEMFFMCGRALSFQYPRGEWPYSSGLRPSR